MQLRGVVKALAAGALAAVAAASTIAAAYTLADYPAPFVTDSTVDALIVVGEKAHPADVVGAIDLAVRLGAEPTITKRGTVEVEVPGVPGIVTLTGGVSLETAREKLYLRDPINKAIQVLTKDDLSILADGTVRDNEGKEYSYSQYIFLGNKALNYDQITDLKVEDPEYFIDVGRNPSAPLYTLKVVFDEPINITKAVGKEISLFGAKYTIASGSSGSELGLFGAAAKVTLAAGEETTVMVGETEYRVKVLGMTQNSAVIEINGDTEQVGEGWSGKIGGVDVYVDKLYYYEIPEKSGSVVLSLGSAKTVLANNQKVRIGDKAVDGTNVAIIASGDVISAIEINVSAQSKDNQYIREGTPFVDPVFGTFKVVFGGMNSAIPTEEIEVAPVSSDTYAVRFTERRTGESVSIDWAYLNTSATPVVELADRDGSDIVIVEGELVAEGDRKSVV